MVFKNLGKKSFVELPHESEILDIIGFGIRNIVRSRSWSVWEIVERLNYHGFLKEPQEVLYDADVLVKLPVGTVIQNTVFKDFVAVKVDNGFKIVGDNKVFSVGELFEKCSVDTGWVVL